MAAPKRKSLSERTQAYLFLTPALLGLTFITIIPLLGVLYFSFTKWSGLTPPVWIGLQNYVDIFTKDHYFYNSVFVTLYYALGAVFGSLIYTFSVALLLNFRVPGRGLFRAIFYLPYIIPTIAVYIIWTWMYDPRFGVLNFFLRSLGLPKSMWMSAPQTAVPSLLVIAMWGAGNLIVIFLAGLQDVPVTYHEAAKIDGANAFSRFIHITIPMMTSVIFFNLLMSIITHLQVFVPAQGITKGGPSNSTLFLAFLMYREGFLNNNMGYSAAISFIFFIMVAIITAFIYKYLNKRVFYGGGA